MKKLLMISALLLVGALSVCAQTYYYKYICTVDENGVRSKSGDYSKYLTFTNNKGVVYESDRNGNALTQKSFVDYHEYQCIYNYIGSENGILKYKQKDVTYIDILGKTKTHKGTTILLFSSDYKRLNMRISSNCTIVLELVNPSEKDDAPTQLY